MSSLKLILGLLVIVVAFVGNSHCKQQVQSSIKAQQGQNDLKTETKIKPDLALDNHKQDKKIITEHAKDVKSTRSSSPTARTEKNESNKTRQKSGIKTRSAENKEKKYSLDQPRDGAEFGQENSNQQQYYSSPYGSQVQDAAATQQGYPMVNGGQEEVSKYQGGGGNGEQNGQNIGMLQSLMEQRFVKRNISRNVSISFFFFFKHVGIMLLKGLSRKKVPVILLSSETILRVTGFNQHNKRQYNHFQGSYVWPGRRQQGR